MNFKIFDPTIGVQTLLEPRLDDARLPDPRTLSTGVAQESGLADLFKMPTFADKLTESLRPVIYDDGLLRPDVFLKNLREARERLKESKSPDARRFVRDDLDPLMEDTQLLRTYAGLLLEG
jgi:type III secretion protein X